MMIPTIKITKKAMVLCFRRGSMKVFALRHSFFLHQWSYSLFQADHGAVRANAEARLATVKNNTTMIWNT